VTESKKKEQGDTIGHDRRSGGHFQKLPGGGGVSWKIFLVQIILKKDGRN
jgi:hypothetical protein